MKRVLTLLTLTLLLTLQGFAQATLKGKVTDKKGDPLPGVNVIVKQGGNTIQGVVTNLDGDYSINNVPADATVTFSFIGMTSQTLVIANRAIIDVTLEEKVKDIDEVVIVGYGAQKRIHITGAVSTLNAKEIQDIPSANLSTALEGRLAGVQIGQTSGKPGASTSLKIRENTSFSTAEPPIYIIDDVQRTKEEFDVLDPSEVESISILKDASAAIYGVKASGGAVIVKTKRGKEGKTKVNYSGSIGITEAINVTKMLNAYEHASMLNDGYDILKYNKKDPRRFSEDELAYFKDSIPNGGYDWLNESWKPAKLIRHNLNFSGGTEKLKYFLGGSYLKETGNIEKLYIQKSTIRGNIDFELLKGLTASFEVSIGKKKDYTPINPLDKEDDKMEETFRALLQNPQWIPPTINGLPVYQNGMVGNNPFAIWMNSNYKKGETEYDLFSTSLEYKIPFIKGLNVKAKLASQKTIDYGKTYNIKAYGYNFVTSGSNNHIIRPNASLIAADPLIGSSPETVISGIEYIEESTSRGNLLQSDFTLNYANKFNLHDISAFVVCEVIEGTSERVGVKRSGNQTLPADMLYAFNKNDEALAELPDQREELSYLGRFNYNYGSKYIAEFIFRRDASNFYSPEKRWGFFPAGSVGWVISEENFFKQNISFINFVKIRASTGLMGNDRSLSEFIWMLTYGNGPSYLFGTQLTNGVSAKNNAFVNPDITWEKTSMTNLGFDLKVWDNKLSISVDGFYKYTSDIMYQRADAPTTVGNLNSSFRFNYGKMHGYGYEIEMKYKTKLPFSIDFEIKGNFSWAEAMILKTLQSPGAVGKWYDEYKNYDDNQPGAISTGIVRTQEELDNIMMDNPNYTSAGSKLELGMLNYKDLRGADGSEGPNGNFNFDLIEDRTVIAQHTNPTYNYGTTLDFTWKGIKLNMTFAGKFGHKILYDKETMTAPTPTANVAAFWADHWTPENPNAAYPRALNYGLEGNYSTFWIRNGSYLRLTDLNLSYSLPANWAKQFGIPQLRLFFNTKYLWTIINPIGYKDANLARYNGYPMTRTYNFGCTLGL